jgi:hypothetical protein
VQVRGQYSGVVSAQGGVQAGDGSIVVSSRSLEGPTLSKLIPSERGGHGGNPHRRTLHGSDHRYWGKRFAILDSLDSDIRNILAYPSTSYPGTIRLLN